MERDRGGEGVVVGLPGGHSRRARAAARIPSVAGSIGEEVGHVEFRRNGLADVVGVTNRAPADSTGARSDLLVRNLIKEVLDTVQPGALLVDRLDDPPARLR